jgi:capsular exopolysaccharide synthesis family protein
MNKEKDYKNEADKELNDFLNKMVFHWPLYLLVVTICLVGAFIYLRYTKPVYASSAKIYIKDEKRGGKELDALKELTMVGGNKVVENEMEVIKSPLILEDVIKKNKFNIRYFLKGRVAIYEMYKEGPITLQVNSDSDKVGNHFFDVTLTDAHVFNVEYKDKNKNPVIVKVRPSQQFKVNKDVFSILYDASKNNTDERYFQVKVDSIFQLAFAKSAQLNTNLVNKMASVFELTYEDEVPRRTADFLNEVLFAYNKTTLNDKNQIALNTMHFIEERLQTLGGELSEVEKEVERFKQSRGITEIDQTSKMFLDQVQVADQKLNEANIQLSVYDQIENYINKPNLETPFAPMAGISDPALASLINRYEELGREKKRLSLSLQPGSEIIKNLDQQIAEAKANIKNYIAGYRRNASVARSGMQRKVNELENLVSKVPAYERQYLTLKRQQGVKEALYLYLLQKKEESAVSYASSIVDNKIIAPAYIPVVPVKPKKLIIFSIFAFGGIIVVTGYLYIKSLLNKTVVSKNEIERQVPVPVVAEIFLTNKKNKGIAAQERNVLTEQILNLRNNIRFLLSNVQQTPVLMFTSSISGEGKTFLSAELCDSLTFNNKSVIMLELDLRKPKLAKALKAENGIGLTNYLIGNASLEQVIKKVPGNDRLFLITSGAIPPNPVELIESDAMKNLFVELRKRYDYIVIDTAPVGLVSDAKSIAPHVDCALFVVRFNYTPKHRLSELAENIDKAIFKKAGIVFNGIQPESAEGFYSYGYNSYGYAAEKKSSLRAFIRQIAMRLS